MRAASCSIANWTNSQRSGRRSGCDSPSPHLTTAPPRSDPGGGVFFCGWQKLARRLEEAGSQARGTCPVQEWRKKQWPAGCRTLLWRSPVHRVSARHRCPSRLSARAGAARAASCSNSSARPYTRKAHQAAAAIHVCPTTAHPTHQPGCASQSPYTTTIPVRPKPAAATQNSRRKTAVSRAARASRTTASLHAACRDGSPDAAGPVSGFCAFIVTTPDDCQRPTYRKARKGTSSVLASMR